MCGSNCWHGVVAVIFSLSSLFLIQDQIVREPELKIRSGVKQISMVGVAVWETAHFSDKRIIVGFFYLFIYFESRSNLLIS